MKHLRLIQTAEAMPLIWCGIRRGVNLDNVPKHALPDATTTKLVGNFNGKFVWKLTLVCPTATLTWLYRDGAIYGDVTVYDWYHPELLSDT